MKYINLILSFLFLFPGYALSDCDFSTIKKVEEGFLYSKECHIEVGKTLQEAEKRKEQVQLLEKTITLQDLAIKESDKRIENFKSIAEKNTARLNQIQDFQKTSNFMYFAAGIALAIGTTYAASAAIRR